MAVTHTLPATFSQSLGKQIALPAGAKSLFFFGSGFDGNNANRVLGGPAATSIGSPVYSSNYVTVGYNGSTNNVIDTMNQRSAPMLAAGWTWAAVYRCTSAGAVSGPGIEDLGGGGSTIPLLGTCCGWGYNSPGTFNVFIHSGNQATRATYTMATSNANWHFVAMTYSGGAAGTHTLNDFTGNPAGGTPATFVASGLAAGNNSPCIGSNVPNGATSHTYVTDVAFAYIGQGPMIQADIATLAASVRPWLARRGIVM